MKILLVEDDESVAQILQEALKHERYQLDLVGDGETAWELAQAVEYDLILLDWMLPKLDGVTLCRRLRSEGQHSPVLLLTAKDSSTDRVIGLDAGADDYMVKPFDLAELQARIRALLRRGRRELSTTITWETIQLNSRNNEVTCEGKPVHLTPKEYCLLELFFLNPQRIFSRRAILDRLWDFADSPGEETVSTHIKCVRHKLKAAGAADPIETVHGLGYRLKLQATPSLDSEPPAIASPPTTLTDRQQAARVTARVWAKHGQRFAAEIQALEQAVADLRGTAGPVHLPESLQQEAHRLAGALGMFGLARGSQLARQIEQWLQSDPIWDTEQITHLLALIGALRHEIDTALLPSSTAETASMPPMPQILIVDDLQRVEQTHLSTIAGQFQIDIVPDIVSAEQVISQVTPQLILLNLQTTGVLPEVIAFLTALLQRVPPIPVMTCSDRQQLQHQVELARLGVATLLQQPSLQTGDGALR